MGYEWTELTYQQIMARQHGGLRSSRSDVLLAFLVLVARYESWSLPLVRHPDRCR